MSELEDTKIELKNALEEIEQLKCPIYPIVISGGDIYVDMMDSGWKDAVRQWCERFGKDVDDYDDNEHKFVKLYLAKMIEPQIEIDKDCNNCIHFGEDDDLPEDRCFQCIRSDNIDDFWEQDTFIMPNKTKT